MKIDILRAEVVPDRLGNDEVFVQIQYSDSEKGVYVPFAKWLTQSEQEIYIHDNSALERELAPGWEPFAVAQYAEAKAAEEASRLTMEKAIAALVDAGAVTKATAGKFTQEQVATLETAAKAIEQVKVDAVVEAKVGH